VVPLQAVELALLLQPTPPAAINGFRSPRSLAATPRSQPKGGTCGGATPL